MRTFKTSREDGTSDSGFELSAETRLLAAVPFFIAGSMETEFAQNRLQTKSTGSLNRRNLLTGHFSFCMVY